MASRSSSVTLRHLGPLSLLALAATFKLAEAQSARPSAAQCVSTPGVNLQLLTACERLQSQLESQLTAGGTVALSTEVQITPTSQGTNAFGQPTSGPTSVLATTSAVATSSGLGGFGGAGASSTNGGGIFGGGSSSTGGSGGLGGESSSSTGGFPFFASSSATPSSNGIDSSVGAGSTGAGSNPTATGGNSPSNTAGSGSGNGDGDGSSANSASGTGGASGAQNSDAPGLTQSADNSDPHHYRNTVVIPAAVVGTIVPLLLLALLACCLIRRRRKRKARDSALLADAENEKYANGHGTSHATAVGGAAAGGGAAAAGAAGSSGNHGRGSDPFADKHATAPNGASGTGGYHGPGAGTLAAGTAAGVGAAGLAGHHHNKNSNQHGNTSHGAGASGGPTAGSGYGTPAHGGPASTSTAGPGHGALPHGASNSSSGHRGVGAGLAGGALAGGAGAAALASRDHSRGGHSRERRSQDETSPVGRRSVGDSRPRASFIPPAYSAFNDPHANLDGYGHGEQPRSDTHMPRVDEAQPSQPAYHDFGNDSMAPGHTGLGMGAAGLGAGAGAAAMGPHEHSRESSLPSNYSSAPSQQDAFRGFSSTNTPLGSSPVPPSNANDTPRASNISGGTGSLLGLGALGAGAGAASNRHRGQDRYPAAPASTASSERPPTLPPMDPEIGTGKWLGEDIGGPGIRNTGNMPSDPADHYDSDYGVPREDTSDRFSGGITDNRPSANYSRPSAASSQRPSDVPGSAPSTYGSRYDERSAPATYNSRFDAPAAAAYGSVQDNPFKTPPRSDRVSNDVAPSLPTRSPERTPQMGPQRQFSPNSPVAQHYQRPASPMAEGSKASQVLGFGSGSGRASPVQRTREEQPSSSGARRGEYMPPSVGEIKSGPYRGPGYMSPQIGPEHDDLEDVPTQAQTSLQPQQVTSYPSEHEVRGFNFGDTMEGRPSGEIEQAQSARRFSVPRKPVGGGY